MNKLIGNLGGAIGSRFLKNRNQLVFIEWNGSISKYDFVQSLAATVSQGTTILKGTWLFDCETGANIAPGVTADLWWQQVDGVKRNIVPSGNAKVVNLGLVDFNLVTPFTIQTYSYNNTAIIGNNDATNKLLVGDVFCIKTNEGNYCKIKVLAYGYDLKIQWVTYRLNPAYTKIGLGYVQPEDIAVLSDEQTAYVTERGGNLLRVNLASANRASATVVCTGLNNPQQLWVDEAHKQAYIVEYANPGKLVRVDLNTGVKTVLYDKLNLADGLIVSSDLSYAYVSEQGTSSLSQIELSTGIKKSVATGLSNPFFLAWADVSESRILVPERDPANRISVVDISKSAANVTPLITPASFRPSSIAIVQPGTYCVCCNDEIDQYMLSAGISSGLYMGIGNVPFNLITSTGYANTTSQPLYIYQFPANSPFGGTLPVQVDHRRASAAGAQFYRVLVDGVPRTDFWKRPMLQSPQSRAFPKCERLPR